MCIELETDFDFWLETRNFLARQLTILRYKEKELEEKLIGYKGSMTSSFLSNSNHSTSDTFRLSILLDKKDNIQREIENIKSRLCVYDNFFSCLDLLESKIVGLYHQKKIKLFEVASLLEISRVTLNKKRLLIYKKWLDIQSYVKCYS